MTEPSMPGTRVLAMVCNNDSKLMANKTPLTWVPSLACDGHLIHDTTRAVDIYPHHIADFEGKTGNGEFADSMAEIDYRVGQLLDDIDDRAIGDETVLVFTSDNGSEFRAPYKGTAGPWLKARQDCVICGVGTPRPHQITHSGWSCHAASGPRTSATPAVPKPLDQRHHPNSFEANLDLLREIRAISYLSEPHTLTWATIFISATVAGSDNHQNPPHLCLRLSTRHHKNVESSDGTRHAGRVPSSTKQARREAQKAAKQDPLLRKQIQELLKKGDTAKAYQKAKMLLSKQALAAQMDQMADMAELSASQIQANNAMNRMTNMMGQSSRTMNMAQRTMNPERTLTTLEQFRQQNEEYAMSNGIYQDAISQSTSAQVSEDAVHELLGKLADDAGVQLNTELNEAQPSKAEPVGPQTNEPTAEEEDALQQRLRALRA
ncbi:snf7 family protein [Seiridium cupressi]